VDLFAGSVGPLYARATGSPGSSAVTWSILEGPQGGSLGPGPVYTPPQQAGFYHVVATSVADPDVSAQVSVQVVAPVSLVPTAATLETGASLPFTVLTGPGASSSLTASAGSLQPTGPGQWQFTAPATPGACTLTAQSSLGATAAATLTVIAPVQVTVVPAALTMVPGSSWPLDATVTGSANTDVAWTIQEGAAGGAIADGGPDASPVYTVPAAAGAGTCHLIATSAADPARSAVLTVTVLAGGIAINPSNPVTLLGGIIALQAFAQGNQPVAWSLPAGPAAGSIDSYGVYTAPAVPGSYQAVASAGGLSAAVTIQVETTNFSRDGKPFMNSADLAILADAWGSKPGTPDWNPACDLNQDGTVSDPDVALFFSQFGGLP
jgi:hypothetical protein